MLAVGTIGYVALGLSPFDGLYQTAITITTVGYGEVAPPGEVDRAYLLRDLSADAAPALAGTGLPAHPPADSAVSWNYGRARARR